MIKSIYSNKLKFTGSVVSDLAFVFVLIFVFSYFFANIAPLMDEVSSVVSASQGTNVNFASVSAKFNSIMSGFYTSAMILIFSFIILEGVSLYFVLNIVRKVSLKVFAKRYLIVSLISLIVFLVLYNIIRPLNLVGYILDRNVYYIGVFVFLVFFYFVSCYMVAIPNKVSFKKPKLVLFFGSVLLLSYLPFLILQKLNLYILAPIVLIIVLVLISLLKVWIIETK